MPRARAVLAQAAAAAVRALSLALLLCCCGVVASCGSRPTVHDLGRHDSVRFLDRVVLGDRQLIVVPDERWERDPTTGVWSFRALARFYCVILKVPDGELSFRFLPDEPTSRLSFTASWDGVPILDEPQRPSLEGSTLRIPARLVTTGFHTLRVERVGKADPADLRDQHDNRFAEVSYAAGSSCYSFSLDDVDRERYIGMLAAREVTGLGPQKMTGCLFEGPRTAVAELELKISGRVSFVVENNSPAPARFSLAVGHRAVTQMVAPAARDDIDVAVEPGLRELRLGVAGLDGGLFLWGAPELVADEPSSAVPIVLVTLDTTRRDALSPYGGPSAATPRLEGFAGRATVFENAWAASPWTLPSHASIFTGLYPYRHGAGVWEDHLTARHETIATLLGAEGYLTAGFAGGALSSAVWGVARGFQLYRDPEGFETKGNRLIDAVEETLARHHPRQLFLFVNLFDPHALYRAPAKFEQRFAVASARERIEHLPVWSELAARSGGEGALRRLIAGEAELTPDGIAFLRAAYLAEVAFMDQQIGRLMAVLDRHGLLEPALVILVADHGELIGEGGFLSHGCRLDPELMEVPLIIKWPGQRQGHRAPQLVSHVDLFATMLAAAGLEVITRDGLPLSSGDMSHLDGRTRVYMEEHESRVHPLFENMMIAPHLYGIQQAGWRELLWEGGASCATGGPGSWHGAACAVGWEERLAALGSLVSLPADRGVSSAGEQLSDAERQSLEALGYVH
jgi:arylsulfatase A-like enzyme